MKKRVLVITIILLLLTVLPIHAIAFDGYHVRDFAGLLTQEEFDKLEANAAEISNTYNIDVVVVTVDSLDGMPIQNYADDYYDYNGFRKDGILLLIAMEEREYHMTTTGIAIEAFTDFALESMEANFVRHLSNSNYFKGMRTFVQDVPFYMDAYLAGDPIDIDTYEGEATFLISAVIGLVVAGIAIIIMRATMNTRTSRDNATDYFKKDSYNLGVRQDIFLYSQVHKTQKQQQSTSSSSSGGSTVHRSSSGTSHGGRSGKF